MCGSSDDGRTEVIGLIEAEDEGYPTWRERGDENTRPDGALSGTPSRPGTALANSKCEILIARSAS